ncbi:hypothetical protein OK016_01140 [Vibrio chagasii]|nr:hypothetical protein [Vibrio chagasii]
MIWNYDAVAGTLTITPKAGQTQKRSPELAPNNTLSVIITP